jgi:hypothetical protein
MSTLDQVQAEYEEFIAQFRSLILSTVSAEGVPDASYAPFVADNAKNFYIFVSGLATHTVNLAATAQVSILLIEDEAQTPEIFARRRLSFFCKADLLPRETEEWSAIADHFQQKFGELLETLRSLPDFRIYKLVPESGRFVVGFGAAYKISSENLNQLQHLRGR